MMRHVYELKEKNQTLAWGMDHTGGFFLQLFDESDEENEVLLVNADQGMKLSGFSIADEHLTLRRMEEILKETHPPAYEAFRNFLKEPLEETYIGYAFNQQGMYQEKQFLTTVKDVFLFADSITHTYTLTDIGDLRVSFGDVYGTAKKSA
ncbi:hypothetical protein IMZ31_22080 (plasmid) [Pontibacillus sp. ALD_SL1]|uniref:hypothetical protein n=1 Tax=Pontibacillus sp. ALD_SL1 TaxID=2777185 RepID=UPI001A97956A|nr:hypothetical protein [Pontibacillus sp. ALD_SL1]QST02143.1 hypothetical protein IMZ31_22080 [Pontibacillus sp. ALD_SL1]